TLRPGGPDDRREGPVCWLELDTSRDLHVARRTNGCDSAEARAVASFRGQVGGRRIGEAGDVEGGVHGIELGVVEGVEGIQPEFEFGTLLEADLLGEGDIPAIDRRAIEEVAA